MNTNLYHTSNKANRKELVVKTSCPIDNFQLDLCFEYWIRASEKKRNVLDYLFALGIQHRKIFPSYERIAKGADCSERNAKRIIKEMVCANLVTKCYRTKKTNKKQSSNQYSLSKEAYTLMRWLKSKKFTNASLKRNLYIRCMWQGYIGQKNDVTPNPPISHRQKLDHTLSSSFTLSKDTYRKSYFNPVLDGLGMPREAMEYCTKYFSEHILMEAKDSLVYAQKLRKVKTSPQAYFIGTAKRLRSKLC